MALVVFLRGVNVGGHRTFKPAALVKQLAHLDAVNIGAALASHYGVVQPEYVVVPDALLGKTRELKPYFDASYAYVLAMKPKATSKGKTKAAPKPKSTARKK